MEKLMKLKIALTVTLAALASVVGLAVQSASASPPPVVSTGAASVVSATFTAPANQATTGQQVTCPTGDVATGGGYQVPTNDPDIRITESYPSDLAVHTYGTNPQAWTVSVYNLTGSSASVTEYVVCYGTS